MNWIHIILFVNIFALVLALDQLVPGSERIYQEREKEYDSTWVVKVNDFDAKEFEALGFEVVGKVADLKEYILLNHKETQRRHQVSRSATRSPSLDLTSSLSSLSSVLLAEQQTLVQHYARAFNDLLFNDQWHIRNRGQFSGLPGIDVNVEPVWALGFTGSSVQIAIVDDGFQHQHPDLSPRYQPSASRDFNDNDNDPSSTADGHGTACGGAALAAANNSVCGVGVAYGARAAGIRLTAGPTTDATEASGISYRADVNHIYSNSWGPNDDGINVGAPRTASRAALLNNINTGRNNRGSIYVWAAGNGGDSNDNSNYDGYANSRYVIAVGAVGNNGIKATYSENGANLLVVSPSLGSLASSGIRTTDLLGMNGYSTGDCADNFSGTSAATPLVSGVIALMLDANPSLTWRDVQFILASTARKIDTSDSDWVSNGAGYLVNHKYGFGLVNAHAAVLASQSHTSLSAEVTATQTRAPPTTGIPEYPAAGITTTLTIAQNMSIERVAVQITANHAYSGDLRVVVTSPVGTQSVLAEAHAQLATARVGSNPSFRVGIANFGPKFTLSTITAQIVTSSPQSGCGTITNCASLSGKIAAFNKAVSSCGFVRVVRNLQNCGAVAVALFSTNNIAAQNAVSGDDDSGLTIPTCVIATTNYQSNNLGSSPTITLGLVKYPANSYRSGWTFTSTRYLGELSVGDWSVTVSDGAPENSGSLSNVAITIYGSSDVPISATTMSVSTNGGNGNGNGNSGQTTISTTGRPSATSSSPSGNGNGGFTTNNQFNSGVVSLSMSLSLIFFSLFSLIA